ncbi:MAG: flagellar basal body-associated FliL family protein [Candidatus Eisenbacteria sp.]|nr:flagellar basal body-associated FliL family protein [Candidatus Eisenbacteria bacterium]
MADERREEVQDEAADPAESRELAQEDETSAAQERKRATVFGPIMLPGAIVRVALGLLILGGMTTGTFFLVTDVIGPGLGGSTVQEVAESPRQGEPGAGPDLPGDQFLVDQMTINPAETRGKRFLRLGVALETQDGPEVIAELETRKAQVRDLLIREFSARNLDELTDPTVREEIRVACVDKINGFLAGGRVSNLYFTDYVLQ